MKDQSDNKSGSGDVPHSAKYHGFKREISRRRLNPPTMIFQGSGLLYW